MSAAATESERQAAEQWLAAELNRMWLVAERCLRQFQRAQLRPQPDNPALGKYAEIGRRFAMQKGLNGAEARRYLVATLQQWERTLAMPRLSTCRVTSADFPRIVANSRGSSMKTNPIVLTDEEIARILSARI